jgi:hypothetical protein
MIDIYAKRCHYKDCDTIPFYSNKNKEYFCSKHKDDSMKSIKNNLCNFDECNTRAHFNYIDNKKGLYCNIHKITGMVNIISKRILK